MKYISTIFRVSAFLLAIFVSFAFTPNSGAQLNANIGYSDVTGLCIAYWTFQIDCDPTETSGIVCNVYTSSGIVQAKKYDCVRALYRDND